MTETNTQGDRHRLTVTAEANSHAMELTRRFDISRDRIFKAFIDPDAIPQWWGPRNTEAIVDELEARSGGRWRFVFRESDGNEDGFHGVFHDIVDGERIVQTFEYEGMPGHVCLETATFEDVDGGTLLRGVSVFQSVEDRDGMIASGMESGASDSYERLEELLR